MLWKKGSIAYLSQSRFPSIESDFGETIFLLHDECYRFYYRFHFDVVWQLIGVILLLESNYLYFETGDDIKIDVYY